MEHGAIIRDISNVGGSAEKELEEYFNAEVADSASAEAADSPTSETEKE
jgi:hypothetical protein